jgi:hypothetical protein
MNLGLDVKIGVRAGPLTEGELQFVEPFGDGVGGIRQLPDAGVSSHDRHRSPIGEGKSCRPVAELVYSREQGKGVTAAR